MFYSLRSIALLMLLAGGSLGVFAGTLMANRQQEDSTPTLERQVEERVRLYRDMYGLDETKTAAVRQVLIAHKREVRTKLLELHRLHQDEFRKLVHETEGRLALLLEEK